MNLSIPLTVLLPTYNSASFLPIAIKSILNQTHSNFEFLIIDDGSTDNTHELINSYSDERINYLKKEHSGLADTLNYGLKIAKYDWVARMDADDISHPKRLEKQLAGKRFNQNTVSCTWSIFFKNKKLSYAVQTPTQSNYLKEKILLHNYINHSSVIYNRKFVLANGGYNNAFHKFEDYELWLRLLNKADFQLVDEYLVFSRISRNSLGRQNFAASKSIIYRIQEQFTDKMTLAEKTWREYFYGDKANARRVMIANIKLFIKDYRIIIAFITTFLPNVLFEKFLQPRMRLRINYLLKKLFRDERILDAEINFNSTMKIR